MITSCIIVFNLARVVFPNVFQRGAERVVGGQRDERRPAVAQIGFDGHRDRPVGDGMCDFAERIAGAGGDDKRVESAARDFVLGLTDGAQDLAAAERLHAQGQIRIPSEAGGRVRHAFGKDRQHLRAGGHNPFERLQRLGMGAEGAAEGVCDFHSLF